MLADRITRRAAVVARRSAAGRGERHDARRRAPGATRGRGGSEIGWATDGPKGWPRVTTEQRQAQRLRDAFHILLKRGRRDGIERVIWFAWRDFEHEICPWCGAAGLIDRSGDPKPALKRFTRFTAKTR